ncbi:DUF2955 domain-containing protein [Desulfopila sp. IMCC35008]|uniref:DUF2955 domain-containing protein n=1 Tax=Desulfopila sp. IMCC35008 TaxID=2653858 RepID=UPI0013D3B690|nr:DUF2955 domain-containing protein [Desulfopila sp. IMCC35008]
MTTQLIRILRLSTGVTVAVAVSYGYAWMLFFITPIITFIFLVMPVWIGGKMAVQLLLRLGFSLLVGIVIAEFFLQYPLLCIPLYGVLFFYIYYHDTPAAPPMAVLFMTLAITMIPIMSFSGIAMAHVVAFYLLVNMGLGLVFAWLFHNLLPDSLAAYSETCTPSTKPIPPAVEEAERVRLALVSTVVALSAVLLFFAFNLAQHALAMIYICFMAGTPTTNASLVVMKANATATCIGGIAIIIAFNLLVAVPAYPFLIALVFLYSLLFTGKIYSGSASAAAFSSGFTTFLVLLGSSTGVDKLATTNFYVRITQVLFAGIFTLAALVVIERFSRPRTWSLQKLYKKLLAGTLGK